MERKIKFAPEEYYHLYSRGVEKRKIFIRHQDYQRFIALLYIMNQEGPFNFANFLKSNKLGEVFNETKGKALVSILSYTLMPNHFHILVYEHIEGGISRFMMKLLTAYSMYFNTKYKRSGPLFMHPFRAQHVQGQAQYLWIFSYIHLNALGIFTKRFKFDKINHKKNADKFLASYEYSSYPEYNAVKRSQSKILNLQLIPYYLLHTDFSAEDYFKILNKYSKDEEIIEGYPQ
ncbi:hypothetical protein A3G06_00130 [Candidatus Nomurabacteria bacterium RIFCSPLOWO2_12_FULL_46_14]|uniref:Transposase IS200-like domain-containing protein n=1 Tax=Candidatus Nomurabacteria bacterium RIFCSPLOWO2_12_FULL_46_14 TaxID=1801797 RepID=A0A1F6YC94_9BACT|nr:MAG: hypothetical protein A3G06_00130 [Candidatus Nomurabacteria bacterium RIFCSPLOWO2_12_FULL_46_14]